ncbi:MAG: hypothetical protein FJX57_08635 [Alphaproteobacteria bacterium]|nr:hypothetical protein [Alphaproteobacteria bacterium]
MPAKTSFRSTQLLATGVALIICTWLIAGLSIRNAHQAAYDYAERDLRALNRLIVEHAERAIQSIDLMAAEIADQVGAMSPAQRADGAMLQRITRHVLTGMPQARATIVLDESGRSIGDSESAVPRPFNGADREYFRVHAARADVGLFIGPPVKSRINGLWAISLSRRINAPNGGFAGVVTVALDPLYFSSLYSTIDPGHQHAIRFIGSDGTVRASHPFHESAMGQSMANDVLFREMLPHQSDGVLRMAGQDGGAQLTFYRAGSTYPIVLTTGRAIDAIDADWRGSALADGAAATAMTFMIVTSLLLIRSGWLRTATLNEAMVAERRRADHSTTVKARLLGVLDEEFRTSLSAASIFVDLMQRGAAVPGSRRQAEYLRRVQMLHQRLLTKIEQLIDHVRIQAGEIKPAMVEVDPSRALGAVLPMIEPDASAQGVRLKLPDTGTSFLIYSDERRLRELIFDLLANAIRATPHDGRVRLRFALLDDGGATIVVQHSGPRIDEGELALRLEPRNEPDSAVVLPLPGPWRDLAYARATAELLGASLAIESTDHRGTRVTIAFPPERVGALQVADAAPATPRAVASA